MYTFDKVLSGTSFDEAVRRTREALAARGFGVLTEIDVKQTMKTRLGAVMDDYTILGACNPKMAFQALEFEPRGSTRRCWRRRRLRRAGAGVQQAGR